MAEPALVKTEQDVGSPLAEDDLEDSGDVDFFDDKLPGNPFANMYLTRIPPEVWQAWSNLSDDAEIELGTIRQWTEIGKADGKPHNKLQLLLRSDLAQHQQVPKEYNLDIADPDVKNMFIFSEQNTAEYIAKNKQKDKAIKAGIPAYLLRQQAKQNGNDQPQEPRGKRGRYQVTKRGVPKKTKIEGRIRHSLSCLAVDNAESQYFFVKGTYDREDKEVKAEHTNLVADPKNMLMDHDFDGFIKTNTEIPTKAKKQENKTARWAENELMDRLAQCFAEYQYWSVKALRAKIPQPEVYIREILDRIAVLNRTGPFSNNYSLKPEYQQSIMSERNLTYASNASAAPAIVIEDDEDEEDIKMEDVV